MKSDYIFLFHIQYEIFDEYHNLLAFYGCQYGIVVFILVLQFVDGMALSIVWQY